MIYLAIDDKSQEAKKLLAYLESLSFAKIYKEPNTATQKAITEARDGKAKSAKSLTQLFKDLKS